jgi:Lrp/AsnC family transcriptional regulator for asnA, asnC and gidA
MEKLDLKDRKILFHLNMDGRQSFRTVGKKVGLSKDVVVSRVKKLIDLGIIYGFYSGVDITKLGYTIYRYYFSYQFITPEKRKELIEYVVNNRYSLVVSSLEGQYDLSVYMGVKNENDLYNFWDEAFRRYNKYFSKKAFSVFCSSKAYGCTFLLDKKFRDKNDFDAMEKFGGRLSVNIDELDYKILKILTDDARISLIKMSERLKCSSQTIANKISKLKKLKVITGTGVSIDFSKLEYKKFKVDINLNEEVIKQSVIDYLVKNPHVITIFATIGDSSDIEFDFIVKDINQILNLIESILVKFPNSIKDYKYHRDVKRHKQISIPKN